jgi:hypothetical protein
MKKTPEQKQEKALREFGMGLRKARRKPSQKPPDVTGKPPGRVSVKQPGHVRGVR